MAKLDAHCHFWLPERGDYDWLTAGGELLQPLQRAFNPPELAQLNHRTDVLAVQAAASLAETQYLLSLAAQFSQIKGVVGWVDLAHIHADKHISSLAQNPLLVGLRPMLQDISNTAWILHEPKTAALNAMQTYDLCFDALIQPRHLPILQQFASAHPDLAIIIDHVAKPSLKTGELTAWYDGMEALAKFPQVYCKFSGILTEMCPEDYANPAVALAVIRPIWQRLLEWFGTERLVWGSDWPVVTLASSYEFWFTLSETLIAELSPTEQHAIWGNNARRFYGLDQASSL